MLISRRGFIGPSAYERSSFRPFATCAKADRSRRPLLPVMRFFLYQPSGGNNLVRHQCEWYSRKAQAVSKCRVVKLWIPGIAFSTAQESVSKIIHYYMVRESSYADYCVQQSATTSSLQLLVPDHTNGQTNSNWIALRGWLGALHELRLEGRDPWRY